MRKSQRKITYIPETGDLDANYCTGRELMDATKTVVSTLSRNHETSVTFGGDEAYTTGKHVVLPSLPDDAQVTKRQGLVTGGYANHETLHNLLTEFDGETRDMCQRWHRNEMHLTNSIANAMEDVRIEMGGRDLYNGLPKAIDKTAHEVNQQFLDEHLPTLTDEELNDFTRIGAVAITWEGRKRLGYPSDTMQKCLDAVSDDVKRKASMIVDAIQHLGTGVEGMGRVNTEAAYKGCRELHKLAEKIAQDEAKGKNGEQRRDIEYTGEDGQSRSIKLTSDAQSSAGGKRGSGDGEVSSDAGGKGDQGVAGSPTDADATGSSGLSNTEHPEGQPNQGTETNGYGANTNEGSSERYLRPINAELSQAMDRVIGDITTRGGGSYRVLSRECDKWLVSKTSNFKSSDGIKVVRSTKLTDGEKEYSERLKRMGNLLGTMRRKLKRALISKARREYANGKDSGKLDMSKLVNVIGFDTRVFKHHTESPAIDTAVSVCVDLSGSMRGDEISLSTDCCIAIAEALEGTGVSLEITGHNTAGGTYHGQTTRDSRFNRRCGITMKVFKEFGVSLRRSRGSLGKMDSNCGAANADGDAWLYAVDRLLARPERRKVFIALSDGMPAYNSDFGDQETHTRDVVEWMEMNGVDVVGIGILTDAPSRFFPKHVVCNNLNELSKNVMDQLGRLLVGSNFKVDNADLIKTSRANAKQAR